MQTFHIEDNIQYATGIHITGVPMNMRRGKSVQAALVVTPEGSVAPGVMWSSLTPTMVEVDQTGLITAGNNMGFCFIQAATSNGLIAQAFIQITS